MASMQPLCTICFEPYNEKKKCPRLLSCGHSFCSNCLETLLHDKTIDCPTCRNPGAVPTGVEELQKNFALLDIVNGTPKENVVSTGLLDCEACDEKHPANFSCLDCKENMCIIAAQFHIRNKASREHRVVSLKELEANPRLASISLHCPEHSDQEFRFFDEDCGHVICRDCQALNHREHKCVTLAAAASKFRQEMKAVVIKASSQAEKIKAAEAEVKKAAAFMKKASHERRAEMQGFFGELHAALNNREYVLMDKLVGLLQHKESILKKQLGRLQENQTLLETAVQQAEASIQSPSDVQFLLIRSGILSTLETKESYSLVLEPEAQFLPEFAKEEESFSGNACYLGRFNKLPFRKSLYLEKAIKSAGAISDRSTCAAKTFAVGSGITGANPGRKAEFRIISLDSQNCRRKLGGDVYAVKLKAKEGGREFKVDVKDQNDGTYSAEYTIPDNLNPSPCGQYTLSVRLRGSHIWESPFVVQVVSSWW